ncbi:MAG: hypothetical protein LKG11_01580 [Bacilli bacterium]|jgi:ribosomal protein L37AE/L43A|nr:hypothetical protein [Bacilli bacterium]
MDNLFEEPPYPRMDMDRKPRKANPILVPLMLGGSYTPFLLSNSRIKKINCKGLKRPYIVISSHASFADFQVAVKASFPHRPNWICSIEEFNRSEWLMRNVGCFPKRKFTTDLSLVEHVMWMMKRKRILYIYTEARFSLAGINERVDPALGRLIKTCKVPCVVMINHGHFIRSPQWSKKPYRRIPLRSSFEQIVTREEASGLSSDEIQKRIERKFVYNDYEYQRIEGFKVTSKHTMDNIHKILYRCPHCGKEYEMEGKGTSITCRHCGATYDMDVYGVLKNRGGETKFTSVPDWYRWERSEVQKEVASGKYKFEDDVMVEELFKPKIGFVPVGKMHLVHDYEGIRLIETHEDGSKTLFFERKTADMPSIHIEYFFKNHAKQAGSAIDIANTERTFFAWLINKKEALTRLHFAVEAVYDLKKRRLYDSRTSAPKSLAE